MEDVAELASGIATCAARVRVAVEAVPPCCPPSASKGCRGGRLWCLWLLRQTLSQIPLAHCSNLLAVLALSKNTVR